jgi:hypothetical protein
MRKTHKKVLGFVGLGLVAATTAVAATLPSPIAAAAGTTDTINVRVISANPDIILNIEEGDLVTDPTYKFSASYNGLLNIKATLVNYDADGNVKSTSVIWDEDLDGGTGTKDFTLNLNDYGGYGDYVITFQGSVSGAVVAEKILSMSYVMGNMDVEVSPDTGEATVDVTPPDDSVKTIQIYIYNPDGTIARILIVDVDTGTVYVYDATGEKLLYTIPNGYKDGKLTITLEGLPYSDDNYTAKVIFRDAEGRIVGGTIILNIKYQGGSIIVPDTGNFFQGLNITREDYLITGLSIFMTIGVVAFGIVKKSRGDKRTGRISGKNRR